MTSNPTGPGPEAVRQELGAVAKLAAPVVVTQLGLMSMGTVDAMMLGRVSEHALAAGALGNVVSFGMMVFAQGMLMALDPLVAQAYGAQDQKAVARHVQRGLGLSLALSLPLIAIMWDMKGILTAIGQDPAIIDDTAGYIRTMIPGVPTFLFFIVFRQTLQAMSHVRQALWAIVAANVANVVANYALIFGNWGFPELGVVGSGWATSICRVVMVVVLGIAGWPILRPYLSGLRMAVLNPKTYGDLIRLGIPIGFQISVEMWLFNAVALMIGALGARELAAHQIALTLAAMAFMVPLGVAGAASTRVGNAIGRGDPDGARLSAKVSLGLGAALMSLSAMAFGFFPEQLARAFTPEEPVVALAATLLPVAALFQIFDGLQVVGAGVLRGAADTRVPALFAVIGYWALGLPLAWWLGWHTQMGPQGMWWGLTLGLASVAVLFLFRIRKTFSGDLGRFTKPEPATESE